MTCRAEFYVRAIYNNEEVRWPGLAPGEMCHLEQLTGHVLARFLLHDHEVDCATVEPGAAKVVAAAPETAGSQFA